MKRISDFDPIEQYGMMEAAPNVLAKWTGSFKGFGIHYTPEYGGATQFGAWMYFRNDQDFTRYKNWRFYGFLWWSDFGPAIGIGSRLLTFFGPAIGIGSRRSNFFGIFKL